MMFRVLCALTMVVSLFITTPALAQGSALEPCETKMAGSALLIKTCKERREICDKEKDNFRRDACLARAAENDAFSAYTENRKTRELLKGRTATATATFARVATATAALTETSSVIGAGVGNLNSRVTVIERRERSTIVEAAVGPSTMVFHNGDASILIRGEFGAVFVDSFVLVVNGFVGSSLAASPRGTNLAWGYGGELRWRAYMSKSRNTTLDFGFAYTRFRNEGVSEWDGPSFHSQAFGIALGGKLTGFLRWGLTWYPVTGIRDIDHRSWSFGGPEQSAFGISLSGVIDTAGDFLPDKK